MGEWATAGAGGYPTVLSADATSVHQMLQTLERAGLISRRPGMARSIAVLVDHSALPDLEPGYGQSVKTTVQRY